MVRTECIAPGGGQSARPMTLRRPPPLDPKGRGDKRRVGKREMSRRRVWHGPATPARSGERWIARPPRSRGGTPHPSGPRLSSDASVSHGRERCSWNAVYGGRGAVRAFTGMNGAPTSRENVSPERNTGGPPGRESHGSGVLRVPQADGGKGMTQTDGHGCRWLVDHRPGDPGGGSAGEGEQVTRCLGPGRDARGGEPQQDSSSGMWSLESGLRAKAARVRSEGVVGKVLGGPSNSLAAYPTPRPALARGRVRVTARPTLPATFHASPPAGASQYLASAHPAPLGAPPSRT
jgi:hypothetical protein